MRKHPGINSPLVWNPPLNLEFVGITDDSMSFQNIDISKQVEVPINEHVGAFGVQRTHDVHKGVDLYANIDEDVLAVEDGIVVQVSPFTGPEANCGWWLPTKAVYVAGRSGVVCYGEIEPRFHIAVGQTVKAGNRVGNVRRVLKNDKGRPTSMLHMVLLRHGVLGTGVWEIGASKPNGLLDPTPMLALLCGDKK